MNAMKKVFRSAAAALTAVAAVLVVAGTAGAQTYAIRGGAIHTLMGQTFVGETFPARMRARYAAVMDRWLHGAVKIHKKHDDDGRKTIEAAFKGHASMKHVFVADDEMANAVQIYLDVVRSHL